jgi:hypothetical protein
VVVQKSKAHKDPKKEVQLKEKDHNHNNLPEAARNNQEKMFNNSMQDSNCQQELPHNNQHQVEEDKNLQEQENNHKYNNLPEAVRNNQEKMVNNNIQDSNSLHQEGQDKSLQEQENNHSHNNLPEEVRSSQEKIINNNIQDSNSLQEELQVEEDKTLQQQENNHNNLPEEVRINPRVEVQRSKVAEGNLSNLLDKANNNHSHNNLVMKTNNSMVKEHNSQGVE